MCVVSVCLNASVCVCGMAKGDLGVWISGTVIKANPIVGSRGGLVDPELQEGNPRDQPVLGSTSSPAPLMDEGVQSANGQHSH